MELKENFGIDTISKSNIGKICVLNDGCFYVDDEHILTRFTSIKDALDKMPTFTGEIKLLEDVTLKENDYRWSAESSFTTLHIRNRTLTINLNNYTLNSELQHIMTIDYNSNVIIKNGKLHIKTTNNHDGFYMSIGAHVDFNNVEYELDVIDDDTSPEYPVLINIYDYKTIDGTFIGLDNKIYSSTKVNNIYPVIDDAPFTVRRTILNIDKNCHFYIENALHGYTSLLWLFGSNYAIDAKYPTASNPQKYEYGRTEFECIQPHCYIDGKLELFVNQNIHTSDTKFDNPMYGTYMNGADHSGAKCIIGKHASITVEHGHGLYQSNENSSMIIEGGKITGSNGLTLRAGTLQISKFANPEIIGVGPYASYATGHAQGNAGSGLIVGNAIMLESNAIDHNGYGNLHDVIIESGKFISYSNLAIGSYTHVTMDDNGNIIKSGQRPTMFVNGGYLSNTPSEDYYVLATGENADYDIVAGEIRQPVMITNNSLKNKAALNDLKPSITLPTEEITDEIIDELQYSKTI